MAKGRPDECWLWRGGRSGKGYGQFYPSKHRPTGAHRFAWELHNGRRIPDGLVVMHSCDNPPCVNPAHLSIGTTADNLRDCAAKGRNPGNRTKGRSYMRRVDDGEIRRLRANGLTMRAIGELVGCTGATVYRSLQRSDDAA